MKGRWVKYLLSGAVIAVLAGCSSKPTDLGQQYKDGHLDQPLEWVNQPNARGVPVNGKDYSDQLMEIKSASPSLFNRNNNTYQAVQNWMASGADTRQLSQFGLSAYQMEGVDNYGNVQFTGYYTPVVQARRTQQGEFRYPLYRMPAKGKRRLPERASIYAGALDSRYIIAYSNSLMDNFMMEVQGSGYVDYGNGQPPVFFGYGGKNGHAYRSIGKVLIDRGEVAKEDMSMQAIRHWADTHSEAEVRQLLEQNPSFVFFRPESSMAPVKGASAVPLIAKASVASDRSLIPAGTTLLAEVPLLDNKGKFTGKYEMRLMVALDVGGAIKGQHFDMYQGIGPEAGHSAGYYNHYGRVWVLKGANGEAPMFSTYQPKSSSGGSQLVTR
ncbi:murein transglycosylase A [Serratia sp. UGAL515B_01]|uniref:murein transglycosylase A n=1 Tax=Serratia sp. UGAL515B_01 TaxID=2986763 RepID=UPI0029538482|nr:murein transglycosylase A [Serratia sp. UGAL515B_01]WON76009.1 murein transglycosylase A [Serratia sp. UGAL515B_01]